MPSTDTSDRETPAAELECQRRGFFYGYCWYKGQQLPCPRCGQPTQYFRHEKGICWAYHEYQGKGRICAVGQNEVGVHG